MFFKTKIIFKKKDVESYGLDLFVLLYYIWYTYNEMCQLLTQLIYNFQKYYSFNKFVFVDELSLLF